MKDFIGHTVLVTTDRWFLAPDGCEYKGVFGTLKAIHEAGKTLGFIPNRSHANWFVEIGNMIIMGCQVLYITRTDKAETGVVQTWNMHESKANYYERPTYIYNADQ